MTENENREYKNAVKRLQTIVCLEDEPAHFDLCQYVLRCSGQYFEMFRVATREEFQRALLCLRPDLIIADYHLPYFSGYEAFIMLRQMKLDIPFIVVSGGLDETSAAVLLDIGVNDFILKSQLFKLGLAVRRALTHAAAD